MASFTTDDTKTKLEIQKLPDGGFIVLDGFNGHDRFNGGPLFACTDLGEALSYIRNSLQPSSEQRSK